MIPYVKRFRRWLFNGLAAISLLLFFSTIFIWIGSYISPWYKDVEWDRVGPRGGIIVEGDWLWHLGSYRGRLDIVPDNSFFEWKISYWKVALIWALVAAISVLPSHRRLFGHKHATLELCLKCGYDLRATPERCPECGTIPPKKEKIPN
jgi:hypothetical protein